MDKGEELSQGQFLNNNWQKEPHFYQEAILSFRVCRHEQSLTFQTSAAASNSKQDNDELVLNLAHGNLSWGQDRSL